MLRAAASIPPEWDFPLQTCGFVRVATLRYGDHVPDVEPSPPLPEAEQPPVPSLRSRIPGHAVIEEMIARQQSTAAERPRDDHLKAHLDPEAESWYSGALGEIRVGLLLGTLDDGWTVLHSIPVGERGSDLDHLVIGPAGVYVINTKRHFGKRVWAAGHGLRVENHQVPYLRNLELEVSRTEEAVRRTSGLAVDAVGVIAVVDALSVTVTAPPALLHREAHVMDASRLVEFLRGRSRVFSDDQVSRIVEAAVRPDTWTTLPAPATDGDLLRSQFEAMRARVEAGARASNATPRSVPAPLPEQRGPRTVRAPGARRLRARHGGRGRRSLLAVATVLFAAWWLLQFALHQISAAPPEPTFASAAAEQAALIESAGTAAMMIDQQSASGIRPDQLVLTPDASVLQTPEGTILVDLPDGTSANYVASADRLTYTLTLTGPQFGTIVSVTPEAGVVPAP